MIQARDAALGPLAEELQRHQQALEQLLRVHPRERHLRPAPCALRP